MISVDIFGSKFISNTGKPGKKPCFPGINFRGQTAVLKLKAPGAEKVQLV